MSKPNKPGSNLPGVPEEDLNLHDTFSPAIAENGRIRQTSSAVPNPAESADDEMVSFLPDPTLTRLDTVQDLIQQRKAAGTTEQETPSAQADVSSADSLPQDVPVSAPVTPTEKTIKVPFWKRLFHRRAAMKQTVEPKADAQPPEEPSPVLPQPAEAPVSTEPVPEPDAIQLSTEDTLTLENPLTQTQVTGKPEPDGFATPAKQDPVPQVPRVENPPSVEVGTMTISLDEVPAHPFTEVPLENALPPTLAPVENSLSAPTESGQPVAAESGAAPQEDVPVPPVELTPTEPEKISQESPAALQTSQIPAGPVPPQTPQEPTSRRKRRWLWVLLAVLVVFLGIIGGVVPVENIPILRTIAHAMGFTPQEAKQMSFLRALLTWTDKTLGLNGRLSAGPSVAGGSMLFSSQNRQGAKGAQENPDEDELSGLMARYGGKTSLFDMRALNALQIQKRHRPDQIAGTVLLQPGQESQTRASMRDADVDVHTEANRKKSEVYFGSDVSAVNREFYDGYDSIKTLKKIANPHIADGNPIDWLKQMTSRMMKADAGLVSMDKDLDSSVVGWQTDTQDVGDHKAQKDLYHAWITSRMSNYTTSIMLKKTLADASFLNAAIPTHASESLTFGGVRIDTDSLDSDQEGWKEYLEFERKCKEDLMSGNGKDVQEAVRDFNNLFFDNPSGATVAENYNVGFPQTCGEWEKSGKPTYQASNFGKNIQKIQSSCKKAQKGYQGLTETCKMLVDYQDKCAGSVLSGYEGRYNSFMNYCLTECERRKAECEAQNTEEEPDKCTFDESACKADVADDNTWKEGDVQRTTTTIEKDILGQVGAAADYFPQITKGNKEAGSTDAQDYEDSKGYVQQTIIQGMEQNKTRKNTNL